MKYHGKKPKKANLRKNKKPKGKPYLKSQGSIGTAKYKNDPEVYNRADATLQKMVGNKGIPRSRVGMR